MKFLLTLSLSFPSKSWLHINVVKFRGVSDTPIFSAESFIVMDRLYGTLSDKVKTWKVMHVQNKGCFGFGGNKLALDELLKERLLVAFDLANAFSYLHNQM